MSRTAGVSMAVSKPMNSLPFLEAASCQSSGLPGAETGFDPLYLSDFLDIKWLREAELKHGRICMLCALRPKFERVGGTGGMIAPIAEFDICAHYGAICRLPGVAVTPKKLASLELINAGGSLMQQSA